MLLAAVPTSAVCVFVLWLVLAPAFMLRGQTLGNVISTFAPRAIESLPFSVLGFLLGRLYLGLGAAAVLMIVVPILIAREMFASYMRVKESHDETVGMLIHALEAQGPLHVRPFGARRRLRAATSARSSNFMPARLERLRFAALMHDIGKLVVPNQLLNKPGRLTPDEFARCAIHEKVSVQMLEPHRLPAPDRGRIAQRQHAVRSRRPRPPDRAVHRDDRRRVRRDDLHPVVPQGAVAGRRVPGAARQSGHPVPPACVEALIAAVEKRGEQHGDGFEREPEFDNAPVGGLGSAGLGDFDTDCEARRSGPSSAGRDVPFPDRVGLKIEFGAPGSARTAGNSDESTSPGGLVCLAALSRAGVAQLIDPGSAAATLCLLATGVVLGELLVLRVEDGGRDLRCRTRCWSCWRRRSPCRRIRGSRCSWPRWSRRSSA